LEAANLRLQGRTSFAVIPELGSGIHAFLSFSPKAWIPAPSAGMTVETEVL